MPRTVKMKKSSDNKVNHCNPSKTEINPTITQKQPFKQKLPKTEKIQKAYDFIPLIGHKYNKFSGLKAKNENYTAPLRQSSPNISQLRESLTKFQFDKMFEVLGWEHPTGSTDGKFNINGYIVPYSVIAEISNVPVLKFSQDVYKKFESNSERKKFHKSIKDHHHYQHIALFSDEENFFSLSYLSKDGQPRTHSYFKGQSGDYFISKLMGIHFGIGNEPKIADIGNKLETFNSEKVTKRFFIIFKTIIWSL